MNLINVRRKCCLSSRLIVLLCALTLIGCDRGSSVAGKYLDEKKPQEFAELKSDGTFLIHQGKLDAEGKYSIEGKRVALIFNSGKTASGVIEGKTLIGNGGGRWTKR